MNHGGRIVARALRAEGVSHLFTLCGGHIQNIYDGCLDEGIRVVDVRHEQTAGHAADGWARVTGKPGVAAVTAGPGVTDAVTAAANAQRAGVPMLLIGGAGPLVNRHMGSLQDMDHVELMRPITKWSATVTETRRLEEFVATAFRIATTGVPGPVFLEMPLDVLMNVATDGELVRPTSYRTDSPPGPAARELERTLDLLLAAQRPVLVVGSQVRWGNGLAALRAFADRFEMPVYLSGLARGGLPASHPSFFARTRRHALTSADLVVVCGTPFDFRLDYGRAIPATTKVVQVDLDAREIGRNRGADIGLPSDTGEFLAALERGVAAADARAGNTRDARARFVADLRAREQTSLAKMHAELASDATPLNPLRVCAELAKFVDRNTFVIGDGGDFVATAANVLPIEQSDSGGWMDPGPLGTLGVGPGYAMAAKLARPSSRVVIVYGDGSFGLHGLELEAMVRQNIPVVGVIGNDAGWTQILRGQRDMFGEARTPATKLAFTRYERVAEAVGARGFYAETPTELVSALDQAFACGEVALVNVKIGPSDFRKGALSV